MSSDDRECWAQGPNEIAELLAARGVGKEFVMPSKLELARQICFVLNEAARTGNPDAVASAERSLLPSALSATPTSVDGCTLHFPYPWKEAVVPWCGGSLRGAVSSHPLSGAEHRG